MELDITKLYLIFAGVILLTILISLICLVFYFRRNGKFALAQGKLKNSDNFLCDAVPYLKLTNKWELEQDKKEITYNNKK